MTEREKMLAGQLYDCGDAELLTQWHRAKDLVRDYNSTDSADTLKKNQILNELLGGRGIQAHKSPCCQRQPGSCLSPMGLRAGP